jgi:hypothetical protein
MTALVWDKVDERTYESGISKGVIYPDGGSGATPGIAWAGLISVAEQAVGGEVTPFYIDGINHVNVASAKDFQASVTAFSYPPEFESCLGNYPIVPGFLLGNQPKKRFNFAYRTEVSDGYKLHLVYNVLATPTTRSYATLGESVSPSQLVWTFDATPPSAPVPNRRPSAYYVVDSRICAPDVLVAFESLLYGTDSFDPSFP